MDTCTSQGTSYAFLDGECCFITKHTNREKEQAWKLFNERIRDLYPLLHSTWKLDRKPVRRKILDLLKAHRENENAALRAIDRSGSTMDEKYIHLCEKVSARFEASQTERDVIRTKKKRARWEKQRFGDALSLHQGHRQTKRKCGNYQSKSSPTTSSMRGSGKQRCTSNDLEREVLLPILQNTLIRLLRNDTC